MLFVDLLSKKTFHKFYITLIINAIKRVKLIVGRPLFQNNKKTLTKRSIRYTTNILKNEFFIF
ncbi:hypothetical protein GLOIN_2v1629436 [Rhizophagus irregularis DAOM 181602=DAOM 197198]|uniref:Uncharacterized protein n=1 Tax=Rhizophagus irregularis (strain DAOM 181602 / DAOM 197198 / MUCL 43194) TaxID=747089 RepID=A0A2P4PV54_RHIID|nr:hypothetical protein GLOIN_2v1629436 [Rhizophagus irregularis DAOM 181602=DAOM 197198]POG69254.1 hypothetical protein GLOIN_2v1629436 [Rhizophagus irregularis DAOM 181602=DAOM 197198]|eukprot:XP_025176120.1 hypothetical protein GLOIN_2v1629436 [Rhizophagus irregularis DAOM 181602=DAOM 197198]